MESGEECGEGAVVCDVDERNWGIVVVVVSGHDKSHRDDFYQMRSKTKDVDEDRGLVIMCSMDNIGAGMRPS
jgi:hypothetical protein